MYVCNMSIYVHTHIWPCMYASAHVYICVFIHMDVSLCGRLKYPNNMNTKKYKHKPIYS